MFFSFWSTRGILDPVLQPEREGPWTNCSASRARNATFSTAPSCSRRACSAPGCRYHPAPDRLKRSIVPQGLSLPHAPPPSLPSAALPNLHPYSILVLTLCYKDINSFDYHIWNVVIVISNVVSLLCHSPILLQHLMVHYWFHQLFSHFCHIFPLLLYLCIILLIPVHFSAYLFVLVSFKQLRLLADLFSFLLRFVLGIIKLNDVK